MPRYINRKRNHANTNRRPVASNLSVNAPEFIPTAADQRQREPIRTMTFYGHSSAPHSSGNDSNTTSSSATNTDTTVSTVTSSSSKSSQRDELISLLNSGQLDCVVCYERTANNEPIWSCRNCYQIFHLKCIMVWFLKSYNGASWRCPACQNEVNQKPSYVCFCGNLPNPFTDNVDIPHTCGQVCGAKKKNNNKSYECNHKCTILCHPGPCPQCMALVQRNCGCGKIKVYVQCGQSTPVSCQNVCSKQLNCKNHICEKICHGGLCDPCKKNCKQDFNATPSEYRMLSNIDRADAVVPYPRPVYHQNNLPLGINEEELRMLECYCGRSKRQLPCTVENAMVVYFSCGEPCNKKLSCDNHLCQQHCHTGQCEPCAKLIADRCLCGKRLLSQDELDNRKSCTQPIPTCDELCGKPLGCGQAETPHLCERKCHEGQCLPCNLKTKYVCRCGNRSKEIKCSNVTTELTCKKKCNKMLSCGKHRCATMCCDAQEHICNRVCNGLLKCRQHRCDIMCHTGSCSPCYIASFEELYCRCGNSYISPPIRCGTRRPPCSLPCSREHECGHTATHVCHDEEECPPCIALTEKLCYGGHELRFAIPCHIKNVSCGMPCGNPLPCGRHTCPKPCHPAPCEDGSCLLPCNLPKPNCGHPCSNPCHPGLCPQQSCRIMVPTSCICGNITEARLCSDPKVNEYRLQVRTQSMSLLDNIVNTQSNIKIFKILDCTSECAKIERNRRIALALQIQNPDLSPNVTPKYSEFMKEFAKKNGPFCNYIHEKLAELVTNAKQSKQNSRSYSFEVMKYEKRKLVHEYCEHFGCESVAYDSEPNRNVVATAFKDKSWLPNYSVVEVLQREGGCPRVNPFSSIQKRNMVILNRK